jgi:hypothetical protein
MLLMMRVIWIKVCVCVVGGGRRGSSVCFGLILGLGRVFVRHNLVAYEVKISSLGFGRI